MRPVCREIVAGSSKPDTAAILDGRLGRMILNAKAVVKAANTNAPLVVSGSPSLERLSDIFAVSFNWETLTARQSITSLRVLVGCSGALRARRFS